MQRRDADREEVERVKRETRMRRLWRRSDVDLGQLWLGPVGVYEVIAIADSPTVTLKLQGTQQTWNGVIASPLFAEWKRLDPRTSNERDGIPATAPEEGEGG